MDIFEIDNNGTLVKCSDEDIKEVEIPDGITAIGDSAFKYCEKLKSIILPEGVTSIGTGVFKYCEKLKNITVPESVTEIGGDAFKYCSALSDVYYKGTEEMWENIKPDFVPVGASVHFNS